MRNKERKPKARVDKTDPMTPKLVFPRVSICLSASFIGPEQRNREGEGGFFFVRKTGESFGNGSMQFGVMWRRVSSLSMSMSMSMLMSPLGLLTCDYLLYYNFLLLVWEDWVKRTLFLCFLFSVCLLVLWFRLSNS